MIVTLTIRRKGNELRGKPFLLLINDLKNVDNQYHTFFNTQ